jgi:hypothetical protein
VQWERGKVRGIGFEICVEDDLNAETTMQQTFVR